jgi:hypothetical protein
MQLAVRSLAHFVLRLDPTGISVGVDVQTDANE